MHIKFDEREKVEYSCLRFVEKREQEVSNEQLCHLTFASKVTFHAPGSKRRRPFWKDASVKEL